MGDRQATTQPIWKLEYRVRLSLCRKVALATDQLQATGRHEQNDPSVYFFRLKKNYIRTCRLEVLPSQERSGLCADNDKRAMAEVG